MTEAEKQPPEIRGAFGATNRARLLEKYYSTRATVPPASASEHIYRLLLWVDQTIGLAHCYESDKCQPGKTWYGRSLAFHDWVARSIGVEPHELAPHIDWLFRHATLDLATEIVRTAQRRLEKAAHQRAPYKDRNMPRPGEDPELVAIIREVLGAENTEDVTQETWQKLVERIRQYVTLENKRKNLVGEGFEDVISAVIKRTPVAVDLDVRTRALLHDLPGFIRGRSGEKPNKVDVAIIRPNDGLRTLITAKWSIRADREKQFLADYQDYIGAESARKPFEYVLITNEFDPARLMRACEALSANSLMFAHVVHINTQGLRATYGDAAEKSMKKVLGFIDSGRLLGIDRWLELQTK